MKDTLYRDKLNSFRSNIRGFFGDLVEPRSVNEDDRRRERILNIILLGSVVMLALLDGIVLYYSLLQGQGYHEVSFGLFSVVLAFFLFLYALSHRGWFVLASYLLVAVYFLSISYAAYRWGVNLPSALLGYAVLITIASILVSSRFGFWVTGIIAAFIIALWHFQFYGMLPAIQPSIPNNSDALVFSILFALLTTVAWLSNREIERSLHRARNSERALKEERDSLEVKVGERTRELQMAQLEKIDDLYRFAEFGQLASGLFHDLTSILSAVALQSQRNEIATDAEADRAAALPLENALSVQKEIDRFVEAVREQLSNESREDTFNLADVIHRAIHLLSHKSKANHIEILFEHANNLPDYFGHASKFHQVVVNLLMNAIDAFEDMSYRLDIARKIVVRLDAEGNGFILTVEDNGCGIPLAIQPKIFEPFFTTKHGTKGVGIGLAMTKRIVEMDFGGTIAVASEEGVSTCFTVRLPFSGRANDNTNHKNNRNHHANEQTTENDTFDDSNGVGSHSQGTII